MTIQPYIWSDGISKNEISNMLKTVDDGGCAYSTHTDSLLYVIDGQCDTAHDEGAEIVLKERLKGEGARNHLDSYGWVVDGENYFAFSRAVMIASLQQAEYIKSMMPKTKVYSTTDSDPTPPTPEIAEEKPYVSKYNIDNPYGLWITPEAKRIVLLDQCSHTKYCEYGRANDEGWVAIVFGNQFLCIRLNPATVTRRVYNEVLKVIKEHNGEKILLEDIWTNGFGNVDSQDNSKKYIIGIIQKLKFNKLILTDRFDRDRPYSGYERMKRRKEE